MFAIASGSPPNSSQNESPSTMTGHLPENLNTTSSKSVPYSPQWITSGVNVSSSDQHRATKTIKTGQHGWCFGRASVEQAICDIKEGKAIVVVDDEDRENEGDLIIAADKATPEAIAFMVRHTSGVICCAMEEASLDRLEVGQMVPNNTDPKKTAFAVTCDLRDGTTTGISATDRAKTLVAMAEPSSMASDFNRPGHIFPLRYREGGVLRRKGHTEASVDFARLAGCNPAGVLCEIVNDHDGSMARLPDLRKFVEEHNLTLTSIQDLIMYRRLTEKLVVRVGNISARLPTTFGLFHMYAYRSALDGVEHVALVMGGTPSEDENATEEPCMAPYTKPKFDGPVIVRVHSECCTGDVFGSLRCDCAPQLHLSMQEIASAGGGILVYMRGQEGRGIGLADKVQAYTLQDRGRDTVEANEDLGLPVDSREYIVSAQILQDLDVTDIILMTNNPTKYDELRQYNLNIVDRMPVQICANPENKAYLKTKRERMGHLLDNATVSGEQSVQSAYLN